MSALLNKELVTVQPKARSTIAGEVGLVNDGDSYTIWATVVPATAAVVQMLEEGARKSAQWIVMTEGPAKPFDMLPPLPAASPVLTTSKGTLIPVAELDYSHTGAGALLPNCAYACRRVALDEPSR